VSEIVLDASALMAVLREEPGAAAVEAVLDYAAISAVNLSEVQAKLVERGTAVEIAWSSLLELDLGVVDFDVPQATRATCAGSPARGVSRLVTAPASRWPRRLACPR
jgi:PIN domain nuclease of toxin-antitoxin system